MRRLAASILFLCCGLAFYRPGQAQAPVQEKIKELAVGQAASACGECEITVEVKWLPGKMAAIDSSRIHRLQFSEPGIPKGYQTPTVSYLRNGETHRDQVQLHLQVVRKVPVVSRQIKRGQSITADDLSWKSKDLTRLRLNPLASLQDIEGKSAGHTLRPGAMIYPADLQQPPLVEAGDDVKMIYQSGGIEMVLNCRARQDKARGEQVRVHSKETGKTYIGKVLTSSEVLWEKTL